MKVESGIICSSFNMKKLERENKNIHSYIKNYINFRFFADHVHIIQKVEFLCFDDVVYKFVVFNNIIIFQVITE